MTGVFTIDGRHVQMSSVSLSTSPISTVAYLNTSGRKLGHDAIIYVPSQIDKDLPIMQQQTVSNS